MRISDWSSDVCSSDLGGERRADLAARRTRQRARSRGDAGARNADRGASCGRRRGAGRHPSADRGARRGDDPAGSGMSVVTALIVRDVRRAWSHGGASLPLAFFLLVAILFPFALGPDRVLLAQVGGGVIWAAALRAALLPCERLVDPKRAG